MKIKFIEAPIGRPYAIGQVVEFTGKVEEGYARKYLDRGWAVEVSADDPAAAMSEQPEAPNAPAADSKAHRAKRR